MKKKARFVLSSSLLIAVVIAAIAFLVSKAIVAELKTSSVDEQAVAPDALSDPDAFDSIVLFWRTTYPEHQFADNIGLHFVDGVDGNRLHVHIPVAVEDVYLHHFNKGFLHAQLVGEDDLRRMVANDLVLMQMPGRSKIPCRV